MKREVNWLEIAACPEVGGNQKGHRPAQSALAGSDRYYWSNPAGTM
ncbi:hypothetical protein [uncultured Chloroflexus sp.]|nr:hypothetical protein [uncultured Chloroflexus sp.]